MRRVGIINPRHRKAAVHFSRFCNGRVTNSQWLDAVGCGRNCGLIVGLVVLLAFLLLRLLGGGDYDTKLICELRHAGEREGGLLLDVLVVGLGLEGPRELGGLIGQELGLHGHLEVNGSVELLNLLLTLGLGGRNGALGGVAHVVGSGVLSICRLDGLHEGHLERGALVLDGALGNLEGGGVALFVRLEDVKGMLVVVGHLVGNGHALRKGDGKGVAGEHDGVVTRVDVINGGVELERKVKRGIELLGEESAENVCRSCGVGFVGRLVVFGLVDCVVGLVGRAFGACLSLVTGVSLGLVVGAIGCGLSLLDDCLERLGVKRKAVGRAQREVIGLSGPVPDLHLNGVGVGLGGGVGIGGFCLSVSGGVGVRGFSLGGVGVWSFRLDRIRDVSLVGIGGFGLSLSGGIGVGGFVLVEV